MRVSEFFAMDKEAIQRAFDDARGRLDAKLAAFEAQTCIKQQILRARPAFRILTPATAQRASFKEHHGADTGAIVCGIALNIENHKRPHMFRIKIK